MFLSQGLVLITYSKNIAFINLVLYFYPDLDSADRDFIVKFKGEVISLIELLQLLRHRNVTVPKNKQAFLKALILQKQSSAQSCEGICFLEERSDPTWCYCDTDCKAWGDCCLGFQLK